VALTRRFLAATVVATVLATTVATGQLAHAAAPSAATAHPTPAQLRAGLVGDAQQVFIVSSSTWKSTVASASLWELRAGKWKRIAGPYTARLGRNGTSLSHVEGDGTTPGGMHKLVYAFGVRKRSTTKLPFRTVQKGDCWISDVDDDDYNRWIQQTPCGSRNENLYTIARGGPYANAIVTDFNLSPVEVGRGSAIFVHVHSRTKSGASKATSGCVSVNSSQMLSLLAKIDPAKKPRIVIGPKAWLAGAG
jgi:L,D-peptidoglycan transpeptidase YkuD (ErfK/YbiS/YcfS/YnhG family)